LELAYAFSDEPEPLLDPNGSLKDDHFGWGCYSRQWYPQFAVFLLKAPTTVPPGSRIRIELAQNMGTSGDVALVLNRSTYSVSDHTEWQAYQESIVFQDTRSELAHLGTERKKIPSVSIPIAQDLDPERRRSTYVFERGLWLDKGVAVEPGLPASLALLSADVTNRLDMARWLVSNENPLTARVMVNRIWSELFGRGIVDSIGASRDCSKR
jgi:hypothetical protein